MQDEFSSVTHPLKVGGRGAAGFGKASLGIPQPDNASIRTLHAKAVAAVYLLCFAFEDLIQAFIPVAFNELALVDESRSAVSDSQSTRDEKERLAGSET